ncbi:MAG: hypothetical protein AAFR17_03435 [Pseudomonadota bacterium]
MDDDTPLGLELAADLRNAGHEVVLTGSASEAREALWHWDYDLLITDIVVRRDGRPVADGGLGLISWVRHKATMTPDLRSLPIIAISGESTRRGLEFLLPTADRIGADLVLEKPLDRDELLKHVDALSTPGEGQVFVNKG